VCSATPKHGSSRSCAGEKTVCGCCGKSQSGGYDRKLRQIRDLSCGDTRVWLAFEVRRVDCRICGKVKTEHKAIRLAHRASLSAIVRA